MVELQARLGISQGVAGIKNRAFGAVGSADLQLELTDTPVAGKRSELSLAVFGSNQQISCAILA